MEKKLCCRKRIWSWLGQKWKSGWRRGGPTNSTSILPPKVPAGLFQVPEKLTARSFILFQSISGLCLSMKGKSYTEGSGLQSRFNYLSFVWPWINPPVPQCSPLWYWDSKTKAACHTGSNESMNIKPLGSVGRATHVSYYCHPHCLSCYLQKQRELKPRYLLLSSKP